MLAAAAISGAPGAVSFAHGQDARGDAQKAAAGIWSDVLVGSEQERYLRVSQIAGATGSYPWSIRGFGIHEIERIGGAGGPWAEHYPLWSDSSHFSPARAGVGIIFNSGYPYGGDDGPVWAGRGVTASAEAGISFRYGRVSGTIAPIAFGAQNAAFDLMPVGFADRFRDGRYPESIDLPQRFGDGSYSRIDPGQSTLRVDFGGVAAGVSTANQAWGPARSYPIVLGGNAPGFPHAFLGSSTPFDIWIGRAHGRIVWGDLGQSRHSPVPSAEGRRFMAGAVAVFSPRGLPGLELGAARFFHLEWPAAGLGGDEVLQPFEGILKRGLDDADSGGENQLASLFARWTFPASGLEIYGEFAREDHSYDLRDLSLEPEHNSAFLVGFQRVWTGETRWAVLRGELVDADVTHLEQVRYQTYFYPHGVRKQGHTHRGQLLGSPAVYGGGGAVIALDIYHPGGRLTSFIERQRRGEGADPTDPAGSWNHDVIYSAGVEALRLGKPLELTAGLTGAWNLNRYYAADRFNLNARVLLRAGF